MARKKTDPFTFTGDASTTDAIGQSAVSAVASQGRKRHKGGGGHGHKHKGKGTGAGSGDGPGGKGSEGSGGPFDSGIPGNITSPVGLDVANEHPDYFWDWAGVKAGLNINRMTPFGDWYHHQFTDLYQPIFDASLLDNPNNKFPNFLGGFGVGSPTVGNPGQTNPYAPDAPGPADNADKKRRRRKRQQTKHGNDNNRDRHNRNNRKGH